MTDSGIHHVTAIAGPARRNLDFYTRVLGLRCVKKTVNFDDPGTYHFYFGDAAGRPGTILTFFPWEGVAPGRAGGGEAEETAFRVPGGALDFWARRLAEHGVAREPVAFRFDEEVLAFSDPDGTRLALVAQPGLAGAPAWTDGGVAPDAAIQGFHSVSLRLRSAAPTGAVLTDVLGFSEMDREGTRVRFRAPGAGPGTIVDIVEQPGVPAGRQGAGSVHHVAFRAASDAEQERMAARLAARHGITATAQRDRTYFRSIYFREPGGVLFEIATDDPGFAVDEPAAALGRTLKLPPAYEPRRATIEAALPRLA